VTARQALTVVVLAALLALAYWAMRRGWERRRARTLAVVPALPQAPADPGEVLAGPFEAVYVSTTVADDWLDRVVAHDLGVRSPATVTVHAAGLRVDRQGARDLFLPAAALRGVSTAPGIAGKVVGRDGLLVVTWAPPEVTGARVGLLDTGLQPRRTADRDALVAVLPTLIPHVPAATDGKEKP